MVTCHQGRVRKTETQLRSGNRLRPRIGKSKLSHYNAKPSRTGETATDAQTAIFCSSSTTAKECAHASGAATQHQQNKPGTDHAGQCDRGGVRGSGLRQRPRRPPADPCTPSCRDRPSMQRGRDLHVPLRYIHVRRQPVQRWRRRGELSRLLQLGQCNGTAIRSKSTAISCGQTGSGRIRRANGGRSSSKTEQGRRTQSISSGGATHDASATATAPRCKRRD